VPLVLDDEQVVIEPHGLAAGRHGLDLDLVVGVEALIDHARSAPLIPRPDAEWDESFEPLGDHTDNGAVDGTDSGAVDRTDNGAAGSAGHADQSVAGQNVPAAGRFDEAGPVAAEPGRPQVDVETVVPARASESTDQEVEIDQGLLIRVLGPVELEGGLPESLEAGTDHDEQPDSWPAAGQAVEAAEEVELSILSFLALSGPSNLERIADAVWPGDATAAPRTQRVLQRLGHRLGPLLAATDDGRYRLRSTVTDLGAARRFIEQARRVEPARAMNLLHTALADVRGRPFEGVDPRYWQWLEDHRAAVTTQATSLLLDACFDLCDLAWEANDPALAGWACEIAARIEPLQETVATRRAQILVGAGRLREANEVVEEWETVVSRLSGRPAPRGPRSVLGTGGGPEASVTTGREHVG
jgi:hypothetical protein